MQKKNSTASGTLPRDRLSYLWLALGIVLMLFGTTRWTIPLAVWLYPVFLLRFVRAQPLWRGIGLSLLASVPVIVCRRQAHEAVVAEPIPATPAEAEPLRAVTEVRR